MFFLPATGKKGTWKDFFSMGNKPKNNKSMKIKKGHRPCPLPCFKCLYVRHKSHHSCHLLTSVTKVVVWFPLLRLRLFLPRSLNKHSASVTVVKAPGVHRRPVMAGSVQGRRCGRPGPIRPGPSFASLEMDAVFSDGDVTGRTDCSQVSPHACL